MRIPFLLIFLSIQINGANWPQWLGPKRDAIWREEGIMPEALLDLPPFPPVRLLKWRQF